MCKILNRIRVSWLRNEPEVVSNVCMYPREPVEEPPWGGEIAVKCSDRIKIIMLKTVHFAASFRYN